MKKFAAFAILALSFAASAQISAVPQASPALTPSRDTCIRGVDENNQKCATMRMDLLDPCASRSIQAPGVAISLANKQPEDCNPVPNAGIEVYMGNKPGIFTQADRFEPVYQWCEERGTSNGGESRCYPSTSYREHPLPKGAPFSLSVNGTWAAIKCYVHTSRAVDPTPEQPPKISLNGYALVREHFSAEDPGCLRYKAAVAGY